MVRFRLVSALTVATLVVALLLTPAAADAAPRLDRGGGGDRWDRWAPPWERVQEWVVNIWGAGGANADPTGNKGTGNLAGGNPPPTEREVDTPDREPTAND